MPDKITDKQRMLELARMQLARRKLIAFARYVKPNYQASHCHHILAERLEAVLRGECLRLIVNFPRRHGKSLLVSQLFPVWALGIEPRMRIVQCGYAENLTMVHSRKARDILASEVFSELFPKVRHNPGTAGQANVQVALQTAHEWGTKNGGNYYAVGVGGGLAGRGFHIGIIDDPIRGREDALSPVKREKVFDWFKSVFYPAQDSDEIRQHGAIILTMTRWDINDLAAAVQQVNEDSEHAEKWEVLTMPAISDDGKALWPERWPIDKLKKIRAAIGEYEFEAQYQQRPFARDAGMFKRAWFDHFKDAIPNINRWIRYWDKAGTAGGEGARTAGVLVGSFWEGDWERFIIVDIISGRWGSAERERVIKQTAGLDRDKFGQVETWVEQEPGSGGKESAENTVMNLAGFICKIERVTGSKEIRAEPFASQASVGNVFLLKADWNKSFIDEAEQFPAGRLKDQIDAAAGGFNKLFTPSAGFDSQSIKGVVTGGMAQAAGLEQPRVFVPRTFTPNRKR
jgi:predicted phage terminase large subunit-like protein